MEYNIISCALHIPAVFAGTVIERPINSRYHSSPVLFFAHFQRFLIYELLIKLLRG